MLTKSGLGLVCGSPKLKAARLTERPWLNALTLHASSFLFYHKLYDMCVGSGVHPHKIHAGTELVKINFVACNGFLNDRFTTAVSNPYVKRIVFAFYTAEVKGSFPRIRMHAESVA